MFAHLPLVVFAVTGVLGLTAATPVNPGHPLPATHALVNEQPATIVTGTYEGPEGRRDWRLAVPAGRSATARPVLVVLHGCLQDAADIARGSRLDALAREANALVLYPEQPVGANPRKCWNWFDAAHQQRGQGEPALLAALVGQVIATHGGDPRRVHWMGISAGGAMATLVAVAYPEQVASLTSIAGIAWRAAPNVGKALAVMQQGAGETLPPATSMLDAMGERARAWPVLVVHGTSDVVVNVRNAEETVRQFVGVHDQVRARAGRAPLTAIEMAEPAGPSSAYQVSATEWRDEQGAAQVTLLRIAGGGHAFPGGSPAGTFTDEKGPDLTARLRSLLTRPVGTPSAR